MKVKILFVMLGLLVFGCNREPELKFPYSKEEVKTIALPILEAWKNKDFNTLSLYFYKETKVEFIHEFFSPMDAVWGPEEIVAIPGNAQWQAYFDEFLWFDYTKAAFIDYGFILPDDYMYDYFKLNKYKYENDMPKIVDDTNKNWVSKNSGDMTHFDLCFKKKTNLFTTG